MNYNPDFGTEDAFNDYCQLVEKVREVSPRAAKILQKPEEIDTDAIFVYGKYLDDCFIWFMSDEGDEFWEEIQLKIVTEEHPDYDFWKSLED